MHDFGPAPRQPIATTWVILPVYNEADALPRLLRALEEELPRRGTPFRILVVDDGSTDGSRELVASWPQSPPIQHHIHSGNLGLAAALRTGLTAAASQAAPADALVVMDADDTHHPRFIAPLLACLEAGHHAAIAGRFAAGAQQRGVPPSRRILAVGAALVFKTAFPLPGVWDYTCGYRAYRAQAVQEALRVYGDALIESRQGFAASPELLIKLRLIGARVAEVPFDLRYDRKRGASKMRVLDTVFGSLALVLRYGGIRHPPKPRSPTR